MTHEVSTQPSICPTANGAPATVFDLANWRIKVPDVDGTTYGPDALATLDNAFFCLSDDGAMVFYAPVTGGTDGSTYPRSELREMVDPDSSSVGWVISGTHTMSATTTVTQEPSNGKIVIAQVDSLSDDILAKIQWDNDRVRVQLREINADGSTGSYANHYFDGGSTSVPVGTAFDWEMTVVDGVLSVTVNGETVTHDFAIIPEVDRQSVALSTPSDYVDDEFYFSAGSQPQDNTQDDPEGTIEAGEVLFHSFDVIHADAVPAAVTISDVTIEEGKGAVVVIKLDSVRSSDTTMSVQTMDGTATGGILFRTAIDYLSVDTVATIAAGTLSTTVMIQTIDDADVEGQETLTVTLSNLMGINVTLADDRAQVVITEDDSDETSSTVTVNPEVGATLTFSDTEGGQTTPVTTIEIPSGAVSETVTLMYGALDENVDDGGQFVFAGTRFEMTAYVDGEASDHYTFAAPVRVTLYYTDTQITDMNEETLRLQFWTGTDWIDAAATCYNDDPTQVPVDAYVRDEASKTISVEICHLTEFALFAEPVLTHYFPIWFGNN